MKQEQPYRRLIVTLSIIIPLVVATLFKVKIRGYDFSFLPHVYASINGLTAVFLIMAYFAIRNGKRQIHELLMKLCIGLSASFLVMYIIYHMTSETTPFGGEGIIRYAYFFILASHILLSVCIVPMVLFTFVRALYGNFEQHKALARYTFPLWLYVAVSGVVVYLMISPYYTK
jgi:putative membrane protein